MATPKAVPMMAYLKSEAQGRTELKIQLPASRGLPWLYTKFKLMFLDLNIPVSTCYGSLVFHFPFPALPLSPEPHPWSLQLSELFPSSRVIQVQQDLATRALVVGSLLFWLPAILPHLPLNSLIDSSIKDMKIIAMW